jgi:RNA polymerase sigma-70 factor (TIGR02960 family)
MTTMDTRATEPPSTEPPSTEIAEEEFARVAESHRRALHLHCYRMLGNFEDAEDVVQEVLLRAWNARDRADFSDPSGIRAWLYRIATNACIDVRRSTSRRISALGSFADIPWLQPYPDRLLDEIAPSRPTADPDAVAVARETVELAFIALVHLLPPRQRAVLLLRDVLEWSAAETAAALDMSVPAANSALQRARATLAERGAARDERTPVDIDLESELLEGFMDAHERADAEASIALMHEAIRVTMPPLGRLYDGRESMAPLLEAAFGDESEGEWRLIRADCNRMPAAVSYLRRPGDSEFRVFKVDVIRIQDGKVREVTTFDASLREALGVPEVLHG